jgi:hypothetical protein
MTMRISLLGAAVAMVALSPLAASAQASNDDAYCKALIQKYESLVANMTTGRSPMVEPVDGKLAVEQCRSGKPAAGIPVLEQKLRNARIDLPARG